jgi:hypothetical protein
MTLADHLESGQELMNKLIPNTIRILAHTHPLESSNLAAAVSQQGVKDHMAKVFALGTITKLNSFDPSIPKLLQEVYPGYIEGTWNPHKADPNGNQGYGQFTIRKPDGSTQEIHINPPTIDALMTSVLSPKEITDYALHLREQAGKDAGTAAQAKHWDDTVNVERDRLALYDKQHTEDRDLRRSQMEVNAANTESARETQKLTAETRVRAQDEKDRNDSISAIDKSLGINNTMLATLDEKQQAARIAAHTYVNGIADLNNVQPNGANFSRLANVVQQIRSGTLGMYPKEGKWYTDPGGGKPPIMLPPQLVQQLAPKAYGAAQSGAQQPGKGNGLQR